MGIEGHLTVAEAAVFLGVSGGRVRQLIADNKIPSVKVGNMRLIKQSDLESFEMPVMGRPKVASPSKNTLAQRKYREKK